MTGDEVCVGRWPQERASFFEAVSYANEMCDAAELALADTAWPNASIQALLDQAQAACDEAHGLAGPVGAP
jgi:hypothetical protein